MGRPKLAKGEQQIPLPMRFKRNDVAAFKRAARKANVSVKEWATAVLTKAAGRT